jgi:hypothetical protein
LRCARQLINKNIMLLLWNLWRLWYLSGFLNS